MEPIRICIDIVFCVCVGKCGDILFACEDVCLRVRERGWMFYLVGMGTFCA